MLVDQTVKIFLDQPEVFRKFLLYLLPEILPDRLIDQPLVFLRIHDAPGPMFSPQRPLCQWWAFHFFYLHAQEQNNFTQGVPVDIAVQDGFDQMKIVRKLLLHLACQVFSDMRVHNLFVLLVHNSLFANYRTSPQPFRLLRQREFNIAEMFPSRTEIRNFTIVPSELAIFEIGRISGRSSIVKAAAEWLVLEATKESVREYIIEVLGEGAWQYACYNFDLKNLIANSSNVYEVAEKIQDLSEDKLNGQEETDTE